MTTSKLPESLQKVKDAEVLSEMPENPLPTGFNRRKFMRGGALGVTAAAAAACMPDRKEGAGKGAKKGDPKVEPPGGHGARTSRPSPRCPTTFWPSARTAALAAEP